MQRTSPLLATRAWGPAIAYAAACLLPLITLAIVKATVLPVPFEDEWEWAALIYRLHLGNLHFADLWAQHNEHRMLVPNAIMLGLALLGGWNQVREVLFSLVTVVVTQIGIFIMLRRILAAPALAYTFLCVSLLLYTLAQMENWDWGFQMAWFVCNACAVWIVVFIGSAGQSWFALAAALVLGLVASFSSSQGLMVWPAGLVALLLVEKRRPFQIAVWIAAAVATFALYFHGYARPAGHPDLRFGAEHPVVTLRYIGAYFGAVFAGWTRFAAAAAVGWVGLSALAALTLLVLREYRTDRRYASRASGFVALATYAFLVAAITTAGRVGFGELQAEASRYTSIAIYCWIAAIALGVAYRARIRALVPVAAFGLWPVAAAAFAVLYVGADWAGYRLGAGRLAEVRAAYPALIAGHGPELTSLYPAEAPVEEFIRELQSVKDGPYYQ